ncbi:unnamed protein product [Discosporangium mesarthrocarpum]
MRLRMRGRKAHNLGDLKSIPLESLDTDEPSKAWATLGVLVSKSPRRQASNGGSFVIWTLSDLSWKKNDVSLFLFQEALSTHWTTCEGMLVAVFSAKPLPARGDSKGMAIVNCGLFQVSKVGMAMDYALCKGTRRDGKHCTMPVNAKQGGYCEFHVVAAQSKAQNKGQGQGKRKRGAAHTGHPTPISGKIGIGVLHLQLIPNLPGAGANTLMATLRTHTMPMAMQRGAAHSPTQRGKLQSLSSIVSATKDRQVLIGTARIFEGGGATASAHKAQRLMQGQVQRQQQHQQQQLGGRALTMGTPNGRGTASPRFGTARLLSPPQVGISERQDHIPTRTQVAQSGISPASSGKDVLGLEWAYGCQRGLNKGPKARKDKSMAAGVAKVVGKGGGGTGEEIGSGSAGKKRKGSGGPSETKQPLVHVGALGPTLDFSEHHMDGSVPVPKESQVFLKLANRTTKRPVRLNPQRSEHLFCFFPYQVEVSQQLLAKMAKEKGVQLKKWDPANPATLPLDIEGPHVAKKRSGGRGVAGTSMHRVGDSGAIRGGRGADPLTTKLKGMTSMEKSLLVNRVSKYASLAEEERAEDASKAMDKMEQREAMAEKAEQVTHTIVTVYDCKQQCKHRRHRFSPRCKDLGHQQRPIKATLFYFECTNCRRRCSSTERIPRVGCEGCGKHNAWQRCGAHNGRGPPTGERDKRFVAALSEWTDQRDLSLAATDFR